MRMGLLAAALMVLWLGPGCQFFGHRPAPYTPRPDQTEWVNEPAVINMVTRYVYEAKFDSRRSLVERQYAALIRYWYTRVSLTGEDLDGGARAVSYIRKIHRDAKGSKDLWERVMELARKPPPGQDGLTIPDDVR